MNEKKTDILENKCNFVKLVHMWGPLNLNFEFWSTAAPHYMEMFKNVCGV